MKTGSWFASRTAVRQDPPEHSQLDRSVQSKVDEVLVKIAEHTQAVC